MSRLRISKIRAVLDAINARKKAVKIAAHMGITGPQLTKLANKDDDKVDVGEIRKFCAAVPIDVAVFMSLNAEELSNMLSETHFFPSLSRQLAENGVISRLKEMLYPRYVLFNVSLSDAAYVLVSQIDIGGTNGVGLRFSHLFPDHGGHAIRGTGHLLQAGDALCFIGEYDNATHYPYVMIMQGPPRHKYQWLQGIGASVTTEEVGVPGACRLIAKGIDNGDEAPHK